MCHYMQVTSMSMMRKKEEANNNIEFNLILNAYKIVKTCIYNMFVLFSISSLTRKKNNTLNFFRKTMQIIDIVYNSY